MGQGDNFARFRAMFNPRSDPNYDGGANGCGSRNSGGGVTGWFADKVPDGTWESACDWHDGCYAAHLPKSYCDEGLRNSVAALAKDGEYWFPGARGDLYEWGVHKFGDDPYAASFSEEERKACTIGGKVNTDCLSRNAGVDVNSFPKPPTAGLTPAQREQLNNLKTPEADKFFLDCIKAAPTNGYGCAKEAERQREDAKRRAHNDMMHDNVKKDLQEQGYNPQTHELGGKKASTDQTLKAEPVPQEVQDK
jgi:hypothetical protein